MANEYPTDDRAVAPTGDTGAHDRARLNSDYWLQHRDKLFIASCIALIVTAMSFAIRGDSMGDVGTHFGFNKEDLGKIGGIAFLGFTLAMVGGGPLCDVLGMGRLLTLAFVGHGAGIILSILARNYTMFFAGTLLIGLGNGLVEAACNPLIATLYPDQKIKRLSQFHMWFPGGIVIGGLVSYAITQSGIDKSISWQIKLATMLLPLAVYAFLFVGQKISADRARRFQCLDRRNVQQMFESALPALRGLYADDCGDRIGDGPMAARHFDGHDRHFRHPVLSSD